MNTKTYCVYILSNRKCGALYIGVTSNLRHRIQQHRNKDFDGFTAKYGIDKLMYFESTNDVESALQREKQLKHWNREWKIKLIEQHNPEWNDISRKLEI
ncbi:MAG: GIY-YIG nuclease family protein [Patescibacteria group bacterium]|nr:GIY-YIG nuclease family protein [Patescibacteria group bacterium]